MFGRFQNPVIELHRESVGAICLEDDLDQGQFRALSVSEINSIYT